MPQDEILSRVLFGRTLGQITAAEGIQVAQAAATLAGGATVGRGAPALRHVPNDCSSCRSNVAESKSPTTVMIIRSPPTCSA